jgi:carcinoembryonic antigen-related cell adhesion molecule
LQVKIESLPRNVAVGKSVLFLVHNFPEVFRAFSWYKPAYKSHTSKIVEYHRFTDSATVGAAYRGIEVIFTNGSMVMIDVTEDDAGFYMLEILREDFKVEKAYVQLHVNSK